jgi:prepilin peptidase CpaA
MQMPEFVAVVVSVAASLVDLRTRRIPNLLTLPAAIGGVLFHAASQGLTGAGFALLGWAVGLGLFLPIYLLRGMGAGDVKLLAALGAWLGPGRTVWVALYGAVAGGVLGLLLAVTSGYGRQAFRNLWLLLAHWRVAGVRPLDELTLERSTGPRLAYAVPVALGLACTLAWR